jgi:hypothetical protein
MEPSFGTLLIIQTGKHVQDMLIHFVITKAMAHVSKASDTSMCPVLQCKHKAMFSRLHNY